MMPDMQDKLRMYVLLIKSLFSLLLPTNQHQHVWGLCLAPWISPSGFLFILVLGALRYFFPSFYKSHICVTYKTKHNLTCSWTNEYFTTRSFPVLLSSSNSHEVNYLSCLCFQKLACYFLSQNAHCVFHILPSAFIASSLVLCPWPLLCYCFQHSHKFYTDST